MGYNNTVAIISDTEYAVNEIKNMLVLLREVDRVECYDYYDAEGSIKESLPNVIILHAKENDKNALKLLKKIRKSPLAKETPVILYPEYSSTDYIVEAFDNGITDILNFPLKDYELVIRVIWAIKKSEIVLINKTKDDFLTKLGIIDSDTGFYKEGFSLKFLESVISQSKDTKRHSCLLLIKTRPTINVESDKELLTQALKSSVRLNDTIAMKDDTTYYIFLSRAKLNGVYSVYERILSKLGPMISISASVVEIGDELFDDVVSVLEYAINKSPKNGELTVVQKQDFIDMYNSENKEEPVEELEIASILKGTVDDSLSGGVIGINEGEADKVNLGIKILNEKVREIEKRGGFKKLFSKRKKKMEDNGSRAIFNLSDNDSDERSILLYKQTYAKKLNLVTGPLLRKYASKFQNEFDYLNVDISTDIHLAFLRMEKGDIKLNFEMSYDGIKTINLKMAIAALGSDIESENMSVEVMDFDYQKLDIILKTLTDEYKNYLVAD